MTGERARVSGLAPQSETRRSRRIRPSSSLLILAGAWYPVIPEVAAGD